MASVAPPKQSSPRQTVQRPADIDHSIIPTAKITPMPMKAQGFASYSICGVQCRTLRFYRACRSAAGFVYNATYDNTEPFWAHRDDQSVVHGAGAGRLGAADRRGRHARPDLLCRRGQSRALRGREPRPALSHAIPGPGAGVYRRLGGISRSLRAVSSVQGPSRLVACRHLVNTIQVIRGADVN